MSVCTDERSQTEEEKRREAVRLRVEEKWGFRRISGHVGVSQTTVHRWCRVAGIEIKPQRSKIVDPISVWPFLEWCDRRLAQIQHEMDAYPAIKSEARTDRLQRNGALAGGKERLVTELGWGERVDTGVRRLYRMRHGEPELDPTGLASRPVIEDALWNAGVHIYDLYPELEAIDNECVAA